MDPKTDAANRRTYYRVEYPTNDRPRFTAGELRGEVEDCSETGVRVYLPHGIPADSGVQVGDRMAATIRFNRGEMADVEGVVVRFSGQALALRLDTARIPFGKILREQWWLRQRYPFRDPSGLKEAGSGPST
ncbi:MAG: PilZ domain-containing protein [Gemmatimonadaceae bacterium]